MKFLGLLLLAVSAPLAAACTDSKFIWAKRRKTQLGIFQANHGII